MKLFMKNPSSLSLRSDRFHTVVQEIKEMGFDSSSSMFINAIVAMLSLSKSTWQEKWESFRKLGFSNEETLSVFKNQSTCLIYSKEKIQSAVEFFTVKQNFELSYIAKHPVILGLNF
ncbi:hypothetical protein IFM89_007521 [Coptis chinensis]|uniref:Uncharacterized protein n=1 Tax=Coptis chinensis TaxID=261450 RepID=A0A835HWA7_9MAGN|nr:hypothetical protein IFM89_007521 [Coptis chinensis]